MRYFILSLILISKTAFCFNINKLNGGNSVVYTDFSIPGTLVPMELVRSYNSITSINEMNGWNGAFGWGWTSPFETNLTVTPERQVLLRDGFTGNTIIFRTEKENPKLRDEFIENIKTAYFQRQQGKAFNPNSVRNLKLPEKMYQKLKSDLQFRLEMAVKYQIKGNIPQGEMLISSEYGYQTLRNQGNEWIRERDGITQFFDKEGRLVKQKERTGFVFEFRYNKTGKNLLNEIFSPNNGTALKFTWKGERVAEVTDNKSRRARYSYDNAGNLTQSIDSLGQVFIYKYENKKFPHLLSRIEYPNESKVGQLLYREIKYDENGLVISHRDKDGSETQYSYGRKPNDPDNNFWTKTITKTAKGTEEVYDEYFIRSRSDGSKYLYKQESKINGAAVTTLFAPCCGKPLQIVKGGEVTNFKYYENGMLAEKVGPNEDIKLEYDPRWKKVTKVVQNGTTSEYTYDDMGNLSLASNDKKERVKLKYDRFGRISEMLDNEKRVITFQYGEGSKPTLISQRNLGSIKISYDSTGRVVKAETLIAKEQKRRPTELKSQEVVKQVMSGFQHLLDILRPAGVNLSAG